MLFWHQNGSNNNPKRFQNGFLEASWRPLGGPGRPSPEKPHLQAILGPLESPFWLQKSSKNRLKFELQSSIAFDQHFGPSGGGVVGTFLNDFGMLFWCPSGKRKFMKNRTAPKRELNFRGSGGSKIDQKSVRKQHPAGTGPQERLGRLPGAIWNPKSFRKRVRKHVEI